MICSNCKYLNHDLATFCSNCGYKLAVNKEEPYNKHITNIFLVFFSLVVFVVILNIVDFGNGFKSVIIVDAIFAILVLFFFSLNYQSTSQLFKLKKVNYSLIFVIIIVALFFALLVHFLAKYLNQNILNQGDYIYYNLFKDSPAPLLFTIISIGLFPAFFEELAFRGIIFNLSQKLTGLKPTIIISSILFSILHFSLISTLWIFPLGILFGYLRAKYNTLLYSMIGHFAYNTFIVLIQLYISL